MEITGSTRVLMIAADPIAHVRTPQAMNALAELRGANTIMVPCHVSSRDLPALFTGLRGMQSLDGIVVTAPHKLAAAALCDDLDSQAALVGAVNAVRRTADGRLVGGTFDGRGFVAGLLAAGHEVRGRAVYLAGAGGAASAIAFALAEAGISHLTIHNRTMTKAAALAERISQRFPSVVATAGSDRPTGVMLAVNGTSAGMKPDDRLPFQLGGLEPGAIVAEVVMQPEITPLLVSARERGLVIQPGKAMLDQQLTLIADFLLQ